MKTLLHIDCSPRLERSVSRRLTHELVDTWHASHPDGRVIYRDLGHTSLPFISEAWIAGAFSPEPPTAAQQQALAVSDELIAELYAADLYVFGIPMFNFSLPAIFKAYIDQVTRVGKTARFTDTGLEGMLTGKTAVAILSRGSFYHEGAPLAPYNFMEPYLRTIFGFIGVQDMRFLTADGVNEVNFGKRDRAAFLEPLIQQARDLGRSL